MRACASLARFWLIMSAKFPSVKRAYSRQSLGKKQGFSLSQGAGRVPLYLYLRYVFASNEAIPDASKLG